VDDYMVVVVMMMIMMVCDHAEHAPSTLLATLCKVKEI